MCATFTKAERLTGKKLIAEIHRKGKAIKSYPFLLLYLPCDFESGVSARLAISVPSRRVRTAVRRNAIKRRVREAYRDRKQALYALLQEQQKQMGMLLIFVGEDGSPDSAFINGKISKLMARLLDELSGSQKETKRDE